MGSPPCHPRRAEAEGESLGLVEHVSAQGSLQGIAWFLFSCVWLDGRVAGQVQSRLGGRKLCCPRHGQHGGSSQVRQRSPESTVAEAAHGGRDSLRIPHDGAAGCLVRCPQHQDEHPEGRERICTQWFGSYARCACLLSTPVRTTYADVPVVPR